MNGTYYLNNNGSRWVHLPKEKVQVVFPDGHEELRTALYYESFGNFSSTCVSIKGKKIRLLPQMDGKLHVEASITYFKTKQRP